MSLADEDTNSILTDNVNRAIQGNVAMHVTQPGGKQCNGATCFSCKIGHQIAPLVLVTCMATLPVALLTLSVSIELVSSFAN